VFLRRPATVFVAGQPADQPRYRFIALVPEGQFEDERRQAIDDSPTVAWRR
jgi:cell division protein FtsI/penicillin-binding protein 2